MSDVRLKELAALFFTDPDDGGGCLSDDELMELCGLQKKEIERLREAVREKDAEIQRLQAIVDKLPKTADGVPVVPGMALHSKIPHKRPPEIVVGLVACADPERSQWANGELDTDRLYSTREAAAAEAEKGE